MLTRILIATLLSGTTMTLGAQSTPSFELSRDVYPAVTDGFSYNSVVTGDFNNDGKPDYIVAGGAADTDLTLYLGNGDGTFQSPIAIATISNYEVIDMAAADLNNDGNLDLVVAEIASDERTGNFEVFFGNGNGTFSAPVNVVTENGPIGIGVGDLNGDGWPDIAVGDFDGQVEIWNNTGGKTFTLAKNVPIVLNEAGVKARIGQFDGDGINHIAAMENGLMYILWNDGKENFTVDQVDKNSIVDFNVADVNQDGLADIAATWECPDVQEDNSYETCMAIDVIYGQGDEKTLAKTVVTNYNTPPVWSPLAVDVNGDGVADLVAVPYLSETSNSPSSLYVWLGKPDSTFEQTPITWNPTTHGAGTIAAADFNRDGMIDLVESLPFDEETEIFINGAVRGACATSEINPTVTVCQPVNDTYLPSPVTVEANAYDTNAVTAMQEYVDNQEIYSADVTSFTKSWTEPAGTHLFVTKAWDDTGLSFRSDRTVTVYNGTPGPACPTAENAAAICLPGGATSSSPVQILGNGWTENVPTAAQLYIDGDLVVNNQACNPSGDDCYGGTSYVNTSQTLSSGTHDLVFKLWDNKGNVYTAQQSVTVN
jgi:FG-GAP-like repeat/Bacterial Ig domain